MVLHPHTSEFLSYYEVELASAACAVHFIEAVCPVYAEQTEHGHVNPDTDTGGTFQIQRVEIVVIAPAIASFREYQCPNHCRFLHQ